MFERRTKLTCRLQLFQLFILVLVVLLGSGAIVADPDKTDEPADEVIFLEGSDSPWRLYIGSMANWMVPVEGPLTKSYKSNTLRVRPVDHVERDDAYQAEFGGGLGQIYWQEFNARDYRAIAAAGGALSMVIRIDEKPSKKVELKMDCGYPCGGAVNVSNVFKAVPEGQWFRMSLNVSCFAEAGADLSNILSPLVVATEGTFKISLADVQILKNPAPESLIPCN
jgi:beta-glucosidase